MGSEPPLSREELVDKIKGCIFGAALGDAFGLATEFMTKEQARHVYGVGPIKFGNDSGVEFHRDGHRCRWHENDFTDDTDQMLVILKCVLETDGILSARHFAAQLRLWSAQGFPELRKRPCGIGFTVGSTFSHEKFGTNPHRAAYDVWHRNERNLAANGAVMRTAVLGVPFFVDEEKVVSNAIKAAKVTHADPRSVVSAVVVSVLVSRMLRGHANATIGSTSEDAQIRLPIRRKYEELLLHGCGSTDEDFGEECVIPKKSQQNTPANPKQVRLFDKLRKFFRKGDADSNEIKHDIPLYSPPAYNETPAEIPGTLPPSMDTFGYDDQMKQLCYQVVHDYKYLLQDNSLCPKKTGENDVDWVTELESHCFPKSLSDLELSDRKSMGYTFKCLGAGIYCCHRSIPKDVSYSKFFKLVITELALEAGDADTNCAVAGALLGCRFGKSNLPKTWIEGLRNAAYIEELTDQLCALVLDKID